MDRRLIVALLAGLLVACGSPPAEARRSPKKPVSYDTLRDRIDAKRQRLAGKLKRARTDAARQQALRQARGVFEDAIVEQLAPRWRGTHWAYAGTSQVPKEGAIACGYYVSTLLRDAGLKVERVKLAQQASERIILSLTGEANVKRFRNVSLGRFLEGVYGMGDGLYVVGLDYHVGLLFVAGGQGRFIHSSNVGCPSRSGGCVIDEPAGESLALKHSRYRVVGRISADDGLMRKWLRGKAVPTR